MDNLVLFSPIGHSDPTRGFRDGSFIHICRIYKPQKVYLYMSKEMCDYDDLDNRYEIFLQKLCQKLAFNCDVIKIRRPDLIRVNDFEAFYGDFTKTIEQIVRENQGDTILLNLSSSTFKRSGGKSFLDNLG